MKNKALLTICIIIAVLYISFRIFRIYESNNIMSNQAVFEVYSDLKDDEIDAYFGLEPGTYDKEKYEIVCRLPVNCEGFKPSFRGLNYDLSSIDCGEEYDPSKHIKYDNTELTETGFELYVKLRFGIPLELLDPGTILVDSKVLVTKPIFFTYKRGKINRIVITKDITYNYCPDK